MPGATFIFGACVVHLKAYDNNYGGVEGFKSDYLGNSLGLFYILK